MLSMLLLIAAAPQSAIPILPPPPPQASQAIQVTMRVYGPPVGCAMGPIAANDPTSPGNGLLWREGGEAVGLYRLLERQIGGCPAPIVVNYRVPGSNALGREMGRDLGPPPTIPPRR